MAKVPASAIVYLICSYFLSFFGRRVFFLMEFSLSKNTTFEEVFFLTSKFDLLPFCSNSSSKDAYYLIWKFRLEIIFGFPSQVLDINLGSKFPICFSAFGCSYLYSRVRNSSTGMFISFWEIFPPILSYSSQYVYNFSAIELKWTKKLNSL